MTSGGLGANPTTTGPSIGEMVCTCRYTHVRIIAIDDDDRDTITTEDGWTCSYDHCCDPADHDWPHPEKVAK